MQKVNNKRKTVIPKGELKTSKSVNFDWTSQVHMKLVEL